MLEGDVKEILRELGESIGASAIEVVETSLSKSDLVHVHALGGGKFLIVRVGDEALADGHSGEVERAVRALRSAARRWSAEVVPRCAWPESDQPPQGRVLARIITYLEAMTGSSRARCSIVAVAGDITAGAPQPSELDADRVPFILKQVRADGVSRVGTSFGEVASEDFYARAFWVDAALIVFFDAAYSIDFVRHRAKQLARELGHLLGELEPPPVAPASVAPVPQE